MEKNDAKRRAKLSGKLTNVLDSRTLTASHKGLADILVKGLSVLDVGCGTGAITRGISEAVGPQGKVVGVDSSPELIEKARQAHGGILGLTFETGDVYQLPYKGQFDVVTSARVLIWLADPLKALEHMRAAVKVGGRVLIADYNHEKIAWNPEPPSSMISFYSAYLKWRSDAGMDNTVADHLTALLRQAGLEDIIVTPQHEITKLIDPDFITRIGIWADTASSRGVQMERDGYITEQEYIMAEKDYREWIAEEAVSMSMYMLAAQGVRRS